MFRQGRRVYIFLPRAGNTYTESGSMVAGLCNRSVAGPCRELAKMSRGEVTARFNGLTLAVKITGWNYRQDTGTLILCLIRLAFFIYNITA